LGRGRERTLHSDKVFLEIPFSSGQQYTKKHFQRKEKLKNKCLIYVHVCRDLQLKDVATKMDSIFVLVRMTKV
jgi:hypothetical protein